MSDELPPLDTADEDELQSAAALARALDGGRAEPGLPEEALQAAGLLRLSAGGGQLSPERKAQLRQGLLAALPPARAQKERSSPRRWWLFGLPLAGAAAAVSFLLVGVPDPERDARESAAPSTVTSNPAFTSPVVRSAPVNADVEGFKTLEQRRLAEPPRALAMAAREKKGEAPAELAFAEREQSLAKPMPEGARQAILGLDQETRGLRSRLLQRLGDPVLARAHAERDVAAGRAALEQSRGTLANALTTLEEGLSDSDARLVRQDLYCRLAETALALGEAQTALEWTRRGLDLDGPPTPFLAQLSALEGDALAQLGDDESAAMSYSKAMRVHEILLDESLDGR